MPSNSKPLDVTIVGGGMIVHDQILPSLYHLQRLAVIGRIQVVDVTSARIRDLVNPRFEEAFPGQSFASHPDRSEDPDRRFNDLPGKIIADSDAGNLVVVAVPDPLHNRFVRLALEHDQHVLCVKPLVQTHADAVEVAELARRRGLFVGVEYHKRFDRRALEAREGYRRGRFGEFRVGYATMVESYYYRHSNFQNWFTKENSDPFTYVGCHYVDQLYFITGLRPVDVTSRGIEGRFPNGNEGFLWSSAQVEFENGGILNVIDGLGYPDDGAGTNDQGMTLFCEGDGRGAIIRHNDQFRGVSHGTVDRDAGAYFRFINTDYFRLLPWEGRGLRPVGYGYESIEASVLAAARVRDAGDVAQRQRVIADIDARGIIATPANSSINELVVEAGRLSILNGGRRVAITYADHPAVEMR